jgi:pimeloyl-ACP methyl ester carboxylesterase
VIVERAGTPIHYVEEGSGSPVLLVHGVGANLRSWDDIAPVLARRHRVLRLDLRGHGQSGRIVQCTLDDFVADIVAVLDVAGIPRVHLIGFSLGGMITQAAALRYPARLRSAVIISAVAGRTPEERQRLIQRAAVVRDKGITAVVDAAEQRWFTDAFRAAHPEKVRQRLAELVGNDHGSYAAAYRVFAESELGPELHRIDVPALVVTGEHDQGSNTRMAQYMHKVIRGSELVILPGLRHSVLLEAPARIAGLVDDFLSRHEPSARR